MFSSGNGKGVVCPLARSSVAREAHQGFKTFWYIDRKNNIFSEAQLDNRRRSKKIADLALEHQGFDLVRVWIHREANIQADAPSRAPWGDILAQRLPIPDMPVLELVKQMNPGGLELLMVKRAETLGVDRQAWAPLTEEPLGEYGSRLLKLKSSSVRE